MKLAFVIKSPKGLYFHCRTVLGAHFVDELRLAKVFDTKSDALVEMGRHWAMGDCRAVKVAWGKS